MASHSSTTRQDSVELESLEPDYDQQTAYSADTLLRRDPPQLTRFTSSDQDEDLDFDATIADHDDEEEEEEEHQGIDRPVCIAFHFSVTLYRLSSAAQMFDGLHLKSPTTGE